MFLSFILTMNEQERFIFDNIYSMPFDILYFQVVHVTDFFPINSFASRLFLLDRFAKDRLNGLLAKKKKKCK